MDNDCRRPRDPFTRSPCHLKIHGLRNSRKKYAVHVCDTRSRNVRTEAPSTVLSTRQLWVSTGYSQRHQKSVHFVLRRSRLSSALGGVSVSRRKGLALEPICSGEVSIRVNASNGNPDEHDDNVEALALAAVVLVGPHAVLLLVPVGTSGRVHAATADMRLAVGGGGRLGRGGDVRLLGVDLSSLRLVEGRGGDEVLDNGRVARELVPRSRGALRSRLGDDGLQNRGLDPRVSTNIDMPAHDIKNAQ